MNCQDVKEKLGLWPDGSEGIDDFPMFMEHVNDCPSCQQDLESMDQIVALLNALPSPTPPRGLENQIMRAYYREAPGKKKRLYPSLYIAAGVAAVFLFGFAMVQNFSQPEQQMMLAYDQGTQDEAFQAESRDLSQEAADGHVPVEDGTLSPAPSATSDPLEPSLMAKNSPSTADGSTDEANANSYAGSMSTMAIPEADGVAKEMRVLDELVSLDLNYRGRITKLKAFLRDDALMVPIVDLGHALGVPVTVDPEAKSAMVNNQQIDVLVREGIIYCSLNSFSTLSGMELNWKRDIGQLVVK